MARVLADRRDRQVVVLMEKVVEKAVQVELVNGVSYRVCGCSWLVVVVDGGKCSEYGNWRGIT